MSTAISSAYEPKAVEEKWYQKWLEQNCFRADTQSSKPSYAIVIPPPNVTGVLTMGHVLNNTIQDVLARRARMRGKEVLWLPGMDHAGIATQNVVEKRLRAEKRPSMTWVEKLLFGRSGNGKKNVEASSSSNSSASAVRVIGRVNASQWIRDIRAPCSRHSLTCIGRD